MRFLVKILMFLITIYKFDANEGFDEMQGIIKQLQTRLSITQDLSERIFLEAIIFPEKYYQNGDKMISKKELTTAIYNIFFENLAIISKLSKDNIKEQIRKFSEGLNDYYSYYEMSYLLLNLKPHKILNFENMIYNKDGL